jgi:hypothetical protein
MSDGIWFQQHTGPETFSYKGQKSYNDPTVMKAKEIADEIIEMLNNKNIAYGNSALNPLRLFSNVSAMEGLCVRIDDKLSRISNSGITEGTEDSVKDLIGYLLLLQVALTKSKR